MSRGRGLRPSRPERSAHRLGATAHLGIRSALDAGLRGAADLSPFLPPIFDQGGTSTCFAHSLASGIYCALKAKGRPLPFVPSPRLIASTTYADVRARMTPIGAALPVLQDDGAELQDAAEAVARWGVCPVGPVVDGRNSDAPDDGEPAFPEPDLAQLQQGARRLVGGEYAVTLDASAPEVIAASLDALVPVWVGGIVGKAYEQLGANSLAEPTPEGEPGSGGHAQVIVGYRTSGAGLEFLVCNSWSTTWADSGMVWASSAWASALWGAWPLAVS